MGFFDWVRRAANIIGRRETDFTATYGNGGGAGFAGGGISRLTASLATWSGSINADLDGSLVVLRARARQLAQSNEHGRRFLSLVAANVVGRNHPRLQVRALRDQRDPNKPTTLDTAANDTIEIHYDRWAKRAEITGRMTLNHLYRTAVKAVARDGETLIRFVRRRDLPYGLALQILEADRLDETLNLDRPEGTTIRQGVEIDGTGRPVALWIKARHPGESHAAGATLTERVSVADVLHIYLPERAEQVRGYSWFHAILLRASQLHGYNDAAVVAARIGASKVAALERAEEAPDVTASMADGGTAGGALSMNVEAGEMFELPPGYKLSSWDPDYPHANFESFVKAAMRGIAAGLDVAAHNLSGDMTDVNYSSARIAELTEREIWMVLQDWFISAVAEPVYREWLSIALLRGDITFEVSGKALPADKLSKFLNASRFQGRRWQWVDPAKDLEAQKGAVDLKVTSRTRIAAEQGEDFADILAELQAENEMLDAAGLMPAAPAAPAAPPADPPAMKELRDMVRALEQRLLDARQAPPAATELHIHQAAAAPVEIRNQFTVPPPPAPTVEIRNEIAVPEQAAPNVEVKVEAIMPESTPAPVEVKVEVNPELKLGPRRTETEIHRDADGEMTGSTAIERDA